MRCNTLLLNSLAMGFRWIPYITVPTVAREVLGQAMHQSIPVRLGQDRGGRNRGELSIALNNTFVWDVGIGLEAIAIYK